jgi:hypothetical protein
MLRSAKILYWELLRSLSPVRGVVMKPPPNPWVRESQARRLVEAGVLKVAVIDERIQGALTNVLDPDAFNASAHEVLSAMGILVPTRDQVDLAGRALAKDAVGSWATKNCRSVDFLVIHQGILDRIGLEDKEDAGNWLSHLKADMGIRELVVTSGRGRPKNMPRDVRYIPLTSIQRWTSDMGGKSKFHLITELAAARSITS